MKRIAAVGLFLALAGCGESEKCMTPGDGGVSRLVDGGCHYACGTCGPMTADITVKNDYADSLFTIRVTTPEGTTILMDGERIISGRSSTKSKAIRAEYGAPVSVSVSAVSLGETYSFAPLEYTMHGGVLRIVYDYDLATAAFTIGHSWP